MKQKELLEKLEGELIDAGDQIRLINKYFSYITGKNKFLFFQLFFCFY
jgi:hypothetical protein